MKNTCHMGGKLEHKWIGPFTVVEVKESDGCIIMDKYSREMKGLNPQIKLNCTLTKE